MIDIIKDKEPLIIGNKQFSPQSECTTVYRFRSALVAGRRAQNRRQEITEEH